MVYLTAPLPLPIGITIKPISRTRAASSQLRLAMRVLKIYVLPMMRYPVTVLHYTPTLLRCSLPLILLSSVFDTIPSPTCATFPDYVTTLPMWERAILVHAMEKPIATPLYQLVLQRMLPSWSSATKVPLKIIVPSVGYLALSRKSFYACKGIARGHPMHSELKGKDGRISLLLPFASGP